MLYREATIEDIPELHRVRMAVRENVLNNPHLVKPDDYMRFLTTHGKGWLCEVKNEVLGFAIIDTTNKNIWALFIHPDHEKTESEEHCTALCWTGISAILITGSGWALHRIPGLRYFTKRLVGKKKV